MFYTHVIRYDWKEKEGTYGNVILKSKFCQEINRLWCDNTMDVLKKLESTERSLLIAEKRKRSDLVIGVPHHAPAGTPTLPCPEHSDSDENTGIIGRHLAERLDCCSIIACNSTIAVSYTHLRAHET